MATTDWPRRIDICPWGFWGHIVGGTPARTQQAAGLGGGHLFAAPVAQDDEIGWNVPLSAGTWTLTLIHVTGPSCGIYTTKLDSTTIGTIDGYSAGVTSNVVTEISGISVGSSGVYTLKLVMATKNASATDYQYRFHWITLRRTA